MKTAAEPSHEPNDPYFAIMEMAKDSKSLTLRFPGNVPKPEQIQLIVNDERAIVKVVEKDKFELSLTSGSSFPPEIKIPNVTVILHPGLVAPEGATSLLPETEVDPSVHGPFGAEGASQTQKE